MKDKYSREVVVLPSICDSAMGLGIANTFDMFMDVATEHAEQTGVGVYDMARKGLGWLTVKTRIHFYEKPKMMDRLKVSTWARTLEDYRCDRGYSAEKNGRLVIAAKTEWAVVDMKTGKLRNILDAYSEEPAIAEDRVLEEPFYVITRNFDDAEELGTCKVTSNDVDLYGHMNNARYAFALTSMFGSKTLRSMNISDIQLVFRHPCFEGDELRFVKKEQDNIMEIAAMTQEGKVALLARLEMA